MQFDTTSIVFFLLVANEGQMWKTVSFCDLRSQPIEEKAPILVKECGTQVRDSYGSYVWDKQKKVCYSEHEQSKYFLQV